MRRSSECPKYILLVDNDELLRATIEECLNVIGFLVITAGNGQEAIEIIDRMYEQISLLITDLCMPVLDGISLIRHVRQFDTDPPIVVITGYGEESVLSEVHDLQVTIFNKPLDFNVLERHVQHIWSWMR